MSTADARPDSQPAPTPRCALVVDDGPLAGRRFEVESELEIGREGTGCALNDRQVSHRHAMVRIVGEAAVIEDLGSTNGTWVNDGRIDRPTFLADGDTIRVGTTTLIVELLASPSAELSPPPGVAAGRAPGAEATRAPDPGPRALPCALIVRDGPLAGRRFEVESKLEIGRREADCTLDDRLVSGRHAVVHVDDGEVVIEDLGSTNGTWVNSTRIREPVVLHDGDVVRVGETTLAVELWASSVVAPATESVLYPGSTAPAPTVGQPPEWVDPAAATEPQGIPPRVRRSMITVAVLVAVIVVAVALVFILGGK